MCHPRLDIRDLCTITDYIEDFGLTKIGKYYVKFSGISCEQKIIKREETCVPSQNR